MSRRAPRSGRLSVGVVALLLGLLVVVQFRTQSSGTGLENLSVAELTVLVGNLTTRNEQLRGEVGSLRSQADDLEAARKRGDTSLDSLAADLARVRSWAGLDRLEGTGVRVTLTGAIDAAGVEDLLNELRNAGAEGVAIDGTRAVAGGVVVGEAGRLRLGSASIDDPFSIEAIGDPGALTGSLTRAGGIVAQLSATFPGVSIVVTPVERLVLPPTERVLTPSYGKARG